MGVPHLRWARGTPLTSLSSIFHGFKALVDENLEFRNLFMLSFREEIGWKMPSKNLVTCPRCGFTFDISYARITACKGCDFSVLGECGYIKCPKCGYEFPK